MKCYDCDWLQQICAHVQSLLGMWKDLDLKMAYILKPTKRF